MTQPVVDPLIQALLDAVEAERLDKLDKQNQIDNLAAQLANSSQLLTAEQSKTVVLRSAITTYLAASALLTATLQAANV